MTQKTTAAAPASSRLRRALDKLYDISGVLGAVFIAAIAAVVLVQVFCNIANKTALAMLGASLGWSVPDYAELAGYFLAAATFFAAAHTLKAGAHIRVSLVLQRLGPRARWIAELLASGLGALMIGFFTYWSGVLVWESWFYGDLSPGLLATPLWFPQSPIVIGLVVLTIALCDVFVTALLTGAVDTSDMSTE